MARVDRAPCHMRDARDDENPRARPQPLGDLVARTRLATHVDRYAPVTHDSTPRRREKDGGQTTIGSVYRIRNDPMKPTCKKCGDHELDITSNNFFFHEVQAASSLVKIEIDYLCPGCGQKTGEQSFITMNEADRIALQNSSATPAGEVKRHHAHLFGHSSRDRGFPYLQYPCVYRVGENVLYPTFEGNVQDGTVIDQHGDPDLLLKFAEQYFRLFCSIMPTERLPNSLIELMPALHLLVVATELTLKAYLIRNDKTEFSHSLGQLYDNLDFEHRNEIEARFAKSGPNANLAAMDIDPPSVKAILSRYDNTYGGNSYVYVDTRYYAEPTTTFKPSSSLHGAIALSNGRTLTLYSFRRS